MSTATESSTQTITRVAPRTDQKKKQQPRYHVMLMDDDDHTYVYVIDMLRKLFGFSAEKAFILASEVDETGSVILDTTTMERAELKRDQIHAFGRDWRITQCAGSMSSAIEPAE